MEKDREPDQEMSEPLMEPEKRSGSRLQGRKEISNSQTIWRSTVIFSVAFVLVRALSWTDPLQGVLRGVILLLFVTLGTLLWSALWVTFVSMLYRWCGWKRFRTPARLVLSLLLSGGMLVNALRAMDPAVRFEMATRVAFPADAREVRTHFSGGDLLEVRDLYFFRTSPDEVIRLIHSLGLKEVTESWWRTASGRVIPPVKGFPDYLESAGLLHCFLLTRALDGEIVLVCNEELTEVYLFYHRS